MTPDLIEKIARAICELRIREVRRFDRTPEEIERQLSASVDYAWAGWVPEATAALSVALDEIGEECAGIAHNHGKVVSNEPIGKACSANIERALRARIADLKRELTIAR
jgi:hypothetical protein